jgi:predicted phage-related endonuclease
VATKKTKKSVELSEQALLNLEHLKAVKAKIKELETLKDELDSLIKAELGKSEVGTHNGAEVVTLAKRETKSIPLTLIEQKFPAFYEENVKVTAWSFLQIKTSATAKAGGRTSE